MSGQQASVRLSLQDVLITEQLDLRAPRPPDYFGEAAALSELVNHLTESPRTVLQALADKVIDLTGADSSGISIVEKDSAEPIFRWHANGGEFAPYVGATMARYDSPCGTVLDTNASQLMRVPECHYPFPQQPHKPIEEVLLVPFHHGDEPVGTVWAITHRKGKQFDREDKRLITSLSRLAAAAVKNLNHIRQLEENTRKAAEDSKRKTEFLAMMSHELRNPISPILTAVEVLKRSLPASDAKTFGVDIIARQSHQLRRIVDDLLDVSRASMGKMELRKTTDVLSGPIRIAIETSRSFMQLREHRFAEVLPEEEITLHADQSGIAQAVSNLLNNAVRYTPVGGDISLILRQDGGKAFITVKDSGVGVDSDKIDSIFEPFSQVGKIPNAGLGIGLTLVRGIVELHGGHVEVRSAGEGCGSEFTICLPLQ